MSKSQEKKSNNRALNTVLIVFVAVLIVIAISLLVLLLAFQKGTIPEFKITDKDGAWGANGTVAVFDDAIKPGSSGEYDFVINNVVNSKLCYTFVMEEKYADENTEWKSFLQYRLKMNGTNIKSEEWLTASELSFSDITILPNTKQLFTLEWRWAWDENDEIDTNIGNIGGEFSLVFHLQAKVVE